MSGSSGIQQIRFVTASRPTTRSCTTGSGSTHEDGLFGAETYDIAAGFELVRKRSKYGESEFMQKHGLHGPFPMFYFLFRRRR